MRKLKQVLKIIIRYGLILINDALIQLPVHKGRVLFESFNGKGLTDNPKAIYDELLKEFPENRSQLVWGVKGEFYQAMTTRFPEAKIVKRWSLTWIWTSATAEYWIFNSRMPTWWKKNRRTTYVQTWHGTPLKHLALDMDQVKFPGNSRERYLAEFVKEADRWNYLVAANQYSADIFERAFSFHHQ